MLSEGATVLTPNNRLGNELVQQYFQYSGGATLDKPSCYPYRNALIQAYEQLMQKRPFALHPVLLSLSSCQHLWHQIIRAEPKITYTKGLLQEIISAWETCENWLIDPKNSQFQHTPQTQVFQKLWQKFNQKLLELNALSEYQLVSYMIKAQDTVFSSTVIWVCFDEFNPQQLSLQNYLQEQGNTQYLYDLQSNNIHTSVLRTQNDKEEYQQLFAWLEQRIQEDPSKIGLVIPDLQQQFSSLERQLSEHFDLALFDISLGRPLSEFPLIDHALSWLQLDNKRLNPHQISLLLQSPWLYQAKEEFLERSQYLQDNQFLQNQSSSWPLFIQDIENKLPKLAHILKALEPYPEKASPSEWIDIFQNRLNTLGFPGENGLNSHNFQYLNRFTSLFDEFRQFQFISPNLKKNEALEALIQLTNNTIFQPQKTKAPIQICGLLEASGCEFDKLWVMSLTDKCLPQKPRLSAFIPPTMQRECAMPHSQSERELDFAQKTLERLIKGSHYTVFSYPKLQGDTPNLPCPLIIDYPEHPTLNSLKPQIEFTQLITYEESYQVPLLSEEKIVGGTALLGCQAKCPFKAFAQFRLKAEPQKGLLIGLDAKDKGILLHHVMELLWKALENQKTLQQETPFVLEQYIDQAIDTALLQKNNKLPEIIAEIEKIRLKRLIKLSLEWEKQRPCFSIIALEQTYTINLSGIDFSVRVDRIDQVNDAKWVIDYKSNLASAKPWNEDRPTEPQLLLYALLDRDINTLILMQLKTGKVLCSGISEPHQDIQGIVGLDKNTSWEEQREVWHQQLSQLAQEFKNGDCAPKPATPTLCQQCEFPELCRYP